MRVLLYVPVAPFSHVSQVPRVSSDTRRQGILVWSKRQAQVHL